MNSQYFANGVTRAVASHRYSCFSFMEHYGRKIKLTLIGAKECWFSQYLARETQFGTAAHSSLSPSFLYCIKLSFFGAEFRVM